MACLHLQAFSSSLVLYSNSESITHPSTALLLPPSLPPSLLPSFLPLQDLAPGEPKWANYVKGVVAEYVKGMCRQREGGREGGREEGW